jgi:hypothetical protein
MLYQKNSDIPKTEREEILVHHAKESIEKSIRLESRLSEKEFQEILASASWRKELILPIHNSSLKNISKLAEYHLLNNLCSLPDASHLHVGLLAGDSFIASLYGNQSSLDQQIGIDWFLECPEDIFYANCDCFLNSRTYQVINGACFNFDKSILKKPIDIYFYDADHSIRGHQKAFTYFNDLLADTFIVMIDDWDCPWIRCATFKAFDKLDYSILYENVLSNLDYQIKKKCQYLAVVRKSASAVLEVEISNMNSSHNSKKLDQKKLNVFKIIEGSWCSKEKANLIMDTIFETSPKVCVEIGVFTGSSFLPIVAALSSCGQGYAYAIDPWSNKEAIKYIPHSEYYDWWSSVDMQSVYKTFAKTLSDPELSPYFTIIPLPSALAASQFKEIDFLHLDGNCSENGILEDFELYFPKVKSGGHILFSNTFFSINDQFFKIKALCILIEKCEVISEIDNNNTVLFRKL